MPQIKLLLAFGLIGFERIEGGAFQEILAKRKDGKPMTPNQVPATNEIEDRRLWNDRRKFHYTVHLPERRSLQDRRSGVDRRVETVHRSGGERRSAIK